MIIIQAEAEVEEKIRQLEKRGYEYLPINKRREEGMIQTPSGRIFTRSLLEQFVKSKQRLMFGNRNHIELLGASNYLALLEQAFPNIKIGIY